MLVYVIYALCGTSGKLLNVPVFIDLSELVEALCSDWNRSYAITPWTNGCFGSGLSGYAITSWTNIFFGAELSGFPVFIWVFIRKICTM